MRCVIVILLALASSNLLAQSEYLDSNAEAITKFLDRKFPAKDSGMVIGLIDESGSRIFCGGGFGDGTDRVVDGDTIFEMGSVTKVFTSLLLLDAVRRGKMNLDDPVASYLPGSVTVPEYRGKEISLLNLAVQDSGLPWHPPGHDRFLKPESGKPDLAGFRKAASEFTVRDLYEVLSSYALDQEPGATFQYSNVGMALLGHAIERATDRDFESLVVDRICGPLELNDTCITLSQEQRLRTCRGHLADGAGADLWDFQAMRPAGGFLTTANDMLKFLSANLELTDTPLNSLMKQTHQTRHTGSKSFGRTAMPWYDSGVYHPPGTNLLGHSGHGAGMMAFVAIDTTNKRGVVVLTNQINTYPNPIGWTLIQRMPFTPVNTSYAVREVIGVGVVLGHGETSNSIRIVRVFEDSPAGEAGITAGETLLQIDSAPVAGQTLSECVRSLSGGKATGVSLLIKNSEGLERTIDLERRPFLSKG